MPGRGKEYADQNLGFIQGGMSQVQAGLKPYADRQMAHEEQAYQDSQPASDVEKILADPIIASHFAAYKDGRYADIKSAAEGARNHLTQLASQQTMPYNDQPAYDQTPAWQGAPQGMSDVGWADQSAPPSSNSRGPMQMAATEGMGDTAAMRAGEAERARGGNPDAPLPRVQTRGDFKSVMTAGALDRRNMSGKRPYNEEIGLIEAKNKAKLLQIAATVEPRERAAIMRYVASMDRNQVGREAETGRNDRWKTSTSNINNAMTKLSEEYKLKAKNIKVKNVLDKAMEVYKQLGANERAFASAYSRAVSSPSWDMLDQNEKDQVHGFLSRMNTIGAQKKMIEQERGVPQPPQDKPSPNPADYDNEGTEAPGAPDESEGVQVTGPDGQVYIIKD